MVGCRRVGYERSDKRQPPWCHADGGLLREHTLRGYDSDAAGQNSNLIPLARLRVMRRR